MSPLLFSQTFPPSFWLCLPGFSSSFLIKMSPGPRAFLSLARSQLGNLPLQHLPAESGWSGSAFALPPLPSSPNGECQWGWQPAETQPCRPGVEIRKKKALLRASAWSGFRCAICERDFPLPRAACSVASVEGLAGTSLRFDTQPWPSVWAMAWCGCSFSPTLKYHSWKVTVAAGSTRDILRLCASSQVFALSSFLTCQRCTPKHHHSSKTQQKCEIL